MKKIAILFTVVLAFYACGNSGPETGAEAGSSVPPLDLTGFIVREIPGTDLQKAERFDESGKVLEEGILRNGKRHGTWIVYNGTKDVPKTVISYVDDVYNGPYLGYNDHGQLELMCSYSANELDGQYVRYASSRKVETGYYKNGKLDGVYKKYYDRKNAVQQEAIYKDGQLHGTMKYFNEAGEIIVEYQYENGEKLGGGIVEKLSSEQ